MSESRDWEAFVQALLAWFSESKRELPWRKSQDPYAIWISEVMLQQTRVSTAIPYYERFLEKFPTLDSLAQAPMEKILKSWEGLGYYSRARNLHAAACEVREKYGGNFPRDYKALIALPGIGQYTAGAVASIAFGEAVPVVDGNVWRVFSRILADASSLEQGKKQLYSLLQRIIPKEDPSSFNQGIMELGSLICAAQNPKCMICPVNSFCAAFSKNQVGKYPVKSVKKILPRKTWVTVVACREDKILLKQRPLKGLWGGLWEFPSLATRDGETEKECVARLLKQLRLSGKGMKSFPPVQHVFSHFKLTLFSFLIRPVAAAQPSGFVWSPWKENRYPMPRPYLNLMKRLERSHVP